MHLRRIYDDPEGPPVLMIHGAMSNGKIFYSESGKGFGPWLAEQGFDVFVADFRGRGLSEPLISADSDFGLKEMQEEDMAAFAGKIVEIKGRVPQHWVSHSWGGVTILAHLARSKNWFFPGKRSENGLSGENGKKGEDQRRSENEKAGEDHRRSENEKVGENEKRIKHENEARIPIASIVFFSSKRRISIQTPRKWYMINFGWGLVAKWSVKRNGYLNAPGLKFGSDNESKRSNWEMFKWATQKPWIDWYDGFDYSAALHRIQLPPILSMTGLGDHVLGHRTDVKLLLSECGPQNTEYKLLSKAGETDTIMVMWTFSPPRMRPQIISQWHVIG